MIYVISVYNTRHGWGYAIHVNCEVYLSICQLY